MWKERFWSRSEPEPQTTRWWEKGPSPIRNAAEFKKSEDQGFFYLVCVMLSRNKQHRKHAQIKEFSKWHCETSLGSESHCSERAAFLNVSTHLPGRTDATFLMNHKEQHRIWWRHRVQNSTSQLPSLASLKCKEESCFHLKCQASSVQAAPSVPWQNIRAETNHRRIF